MFAKLAALAVLLAGATAAPASTTYPPGPGLTVGFRWIVSDVDTYLQGSVAWEASPATLGPGSTAGQFIISSGDLVQMVSQIPNLLYVTTTVDATTGLVGFMDGDVVAPNGQGKFAWTGTNKVLTYTPSAGAPAAGFAVCNGQLFAGLPGVDLTGCTPAVLSSLQTPTTN